MKKVIGMALLFSVISVPVYAGTEVTVNSGSGAEAGASAYGNELNASINAGLSAVTGPSSAMLNLGDVTTGPSSVTMGDVVTGPASASTGPVSAATGPMQNSLTIEGGESAKIPLGTPIPVVPGFPSSQIFAETKNRSAIATGIPVVLDFLQTCQPVATSEHLLAEEPFDGYSGKTHGVFSPSNAYYKHGDVSSSSNVTSAHGIVNASNFDSQPTSVSRTGTSVAVETADVRFPTKSEKYECLGIMTVMANPGTQVPATTPIADARIHAIQKMGGHKHIHLISVAEAIAAAEAMNTAGSGIGVSPGLVGSFANMLTGGTVSAGFNAGKSNASAGADVGMTFYVVSDSEYCSGVVIDPTRISRWYHGEEARPMPNATGGEKLQVFEKK